MKAQRKKKEEERRHPRFISRSGISTPGPTYKSQKSQDSHLSEFSYKDHGKNPLLI